MSMMLRNGKRIVREAGRRRVVKRLRGDAVQYPKTLEAMQNVQAVLETEMGLERTRETASVSTVTYSLDEGVAANIESLNIEVDSIDAGSSDEEGNNYFIICRAVL